MGKPVHKFPAVSWQPQKAFPKSQQKMKSKIPSYLLVGLNFQASHLAHPYQHKVEGTYLSYQQKMKSKFLAISW